MFRLLCLSVCLMTTPAMAQDTALSAYEAGDWARAETLAMTDGDPTVADLILASEAALAPLTLGLAEGMSRREKRQAAVRAQGYARTALVIEPENAQAHLRLAAGLGYESSYVNRLRAVMRRLPQTGRDHMIEGMALDPTEPWGPAMLGAWHLEVVRQAGEGMFDANEAEGMALMRQALAMEDVPVAIPYRFAVALLAADPAAHAEEAESLLARVQADATQTAADQRVADLSAALATALETSPDAAQAFAIERLDE